MMNLRKVMGSLHRREDGQIVIVAAFVMVAVFGFAALAIDIGSLTHERRDLQNAADAMALAGGSQLTTTSAGNAAAQAEAIVWANRNGLSAAEKANAEFDFGQTCGGDPEPNIITVRLERSKQTFLASVIGIDTMSTSVCATARRFSVGGGVGVAPFGVEDDCIFGPDETPGTGDDYFEPGEMITIKHDEADDEGEPCSSNTGNFWLLGIDASGAGPGCGSPLPADSDERKLKEAICFGSITPLCTPDAPAEGEDCETSVDTEPGNVKAISDSIDYILENIPTECDTLAKIVIDGELVDDCNPFLPQYTPTTSLVKIIPVLDGLFPDANGKSNVPIVDFMIVVIDPTTLDNCTGAGGDKTCDIRALYIEAAINPQSLRRALDENSVNNFTSLIN